jgi:hypothetical protein
MNQEIYVNAKVKLIYNRQKLPDGGQVFRVKCHSGSLGGKAEESGGVGKPGVLFLASRCFGFGTQWIPAIRCRCQRAKEEASSMTSAKLLNTKLKTLRVNGLRNSCNIENAGGWGGIRTHGSSRFGGFQDRYHKPLGHPSMRLTRGFGSLQKC